MPLDPLNALLGWLVQQGGNSLGAGIRTLALGDAQQRAFHTVVKDAIDRTVDRLGGENPQFLRDVLTEHRDRLETIRHFPTLATAVQDLVRSLVPPPGAAPVAPSGLADVLVEEIGRGVLENARRGGALAPLVAEAGFVQLLGLGEKLDAVAELIRRRLSTDGLPSATGASRRGLDFAYLDPAEARARIQEEPFTGRSWMMREIDEFIAGNDRGYVVVEADAGSGKTAFALWCSGLRGWPVHYSRYSLDARRTGPAVRNLTAQLIAEWGLAELAPDGALPADADWSSFLRRVLSAAAARRDAEVAHHARRPIVLIVDGLDEAEETPARALPWGLPDDMPRGVYIVATVRTGNLRHRPECPLHWCAWRDRVAEQTADMRAFLGEAVPLSFAAALRETGTDPDQLIGTLLERSGHNWLYLHHVLAELIAGTREITDVPILPRGLTAYYHNAVERLLGDEDEGGSREALLSTLAVLRQPVDRDALTRLAGTGRGGAGDRFLGRQLRPFCRVSEDDRWQLGHVSFNEYLAAGPSTAGPDGLDDEQAAWLRRATGRAHQRIAADYLARFGGLDAGLPRLAADPGLAQSDDLYPLRALCHHLAQIDDESVHRLLTCESDDRPVWYSAHDVAGDAEGFLADVTAARRVAERSSTGTEARRLSLRLRYALTEASVATAFTAIPPRLLHRLVTTEHRGWTLPRALAAIQLITDPQQQERALLLLLPLLGDDLVPQAWGLALRLTSGRRLSEAVLDLIDRLPTATAAAAVPVLADHGAIGGLSTAAIRLSRRLAPDLYPSFPYAELPGLNHLEKDLVHAARRLGLGGPESEVIDIAAGPGGFDACQALAEVIPYLSVAGARRAMNELRGRRDRYRSDALIALAGRLPEDELSDLLTFAAGSGAKWQATPPESRYQRPWVTLMTVAGPRLAGRPDAQVTAVGLCQALHPWRCAEAAIALAPFLDAGPARYALRRLTNGPHWREERFLSNNMIAALAARLPRRDRRRAVSELVDVDVALTGEPDFAAAEELAPVAAFLPVETVRWVLLALCRAISIGLFTDRATAGVEQIAAACLEHEPSLLDDAVGAALNPSAWEVDNRLILLDALAPYLAGEPLERAMAQLRPGPVNLTCLAAAAALAARMPSAEQRDVATRLLATASAVVNDRHRVRAIAAIAPCLPEDLAVAGLRLVGTQTRAVMFPTLFKALDALAPRLPRDELPSALTVLLDIPMFDGEEIPSVARLIERLGRDEPTHSLRDHLGEPPRGGRGARPWLAALAPYLDEPLAHAALPVARGLAGVARVSSLAALVPRLRDGSRATVAAEVLRLLPTLPGYTERLVVLGVLSAGVTTARLTYHCRKAAADLRRRWPGSRGEDVIWAAFLGHLPPEAAGRALRASAAHIYLSDRCRILRPLVPRLPRGALPGVVVSMAGARGSAGADQQERSRTLVALARRAPAGRRNRILRAVIAEAEKRKSWYISGTALLESIPLCGPDLRSRAVAAALEACFDTYDGGDPAKLFAVLGPDEITAGLRRAGAIRDQAKRHAALTAALRRADTLAAAGTPVLPGLDLLELRPDGIDRDKLADLLAAGGWSIEHDGGVEALSATVDALLDVVRWWP